MAASAELKKVAMDCSFEVGGRPPTYTRRAWRVACCEGAAACAMLMLGKPGTPPGMPGKAGTAAPVQGRGGASAERRRSA